MSRTSVYKTLYFLFVLGGAASVLWISYHYRLGIWSIAAIVVAMLIPGRILGYFWRDLLRGLRLLNEKNFVDSKRHSELFLATLEQKPWIRHLIWLGSGTYSRNPKSLALNNLGAAEINLGEFDNARIHLALAIDEDKQNPLPVFNMGALALSIGDQSEAHIWFERAIALGYSRNMIDAIITSAQSRFARTDGQGNS